jgi:GNAT superfamily N-acetyltransferase
MLIEPRSATDPDVLAAVAAQQRELREREQASGAIDGSFPMGESPRYLVATLDGEVVGCGALQALDDETVEIKRMYVRPEHRGRGVARRVLAALEEAAAADGCAVLRLETGDYLPEALRLYASAGYAEIPRYGPYVVNPFSVCFEKRLKQADRVLRAAYRR